MTCRHYIYTQHKLVAPYSKRSLEEEQPHGIYSLQYVKGMMLICLRCRYAVLQETGY